MRPPHLAEIIGTFFLVFAGTGAITINEITHGTIGHAGIALTFGLVVLAMIQTFGDISGAHLNPAVTLGFAVAGRFRWQLVPGYLVAQCVGAGTASVLLHCLFPAATNLGTTLPSGPQWQSFVLETVLTAMLMLTILRVADGSKEKGLLAGVAIGAVVGA
jgi:aquaporin Z